MENRVSTWVQRVTGLQSRVVPVLGHGSTGIGRKTPTGPPEIHWKNQPSSRRVLGCSGRSGLSSRVAGLGYGSSWFGSWVPPELLSSLEIDF
jgi:hypothetical protein